MKNKVSLYLIGLTLFLSACSSLKLPVERTVKTLPEAYGGQVNDTSVFVPITLENYFNDTLLLALFDKVITANPDYQIAQQRLLMANANVRQAKSAFFPSVEVGVQGSGTRFSRNTVDGIGILETEANLPKNVIPDLWLGARVSWEADIWGKLSLQKKSARNQYLATSAGVNLLNNQLFTNVAGWYYELIALDKKLIIYQENYEIQKIAYEIIFSQRETGKATELAVQEFGSQLKKIQAEIEAIKMEIFATEKSISVLIGEYGGIIQRRTQFIENHHELLSQAIPVDSIIHKRPDVVASYFTLEASKADAKAARKAFFPTLKIDAFGALNSLSPASFFSPSSLAGQLLGGLTAPLFNRGQLRNQFYIASRQQEVAFFEYQKSILTAFNELSTLLYQMDKYEDILHYKEEELTMLNRAVEVSNDLYLTGYANYLEIINSQKRKLQTELDIVDYQLGNTKTIVQLYKALGGELK